MARIILHIDLDYFFAQVEERENPQFKGKPVVVGADPKAGQGRGVVSTANYQAREYGIHSAMPISQAYLLCPQAVFLPVNGQLYHRVSSRVFDIVKKYASSIEQTSLDEAYLDVSKLGSWEKAKVLGKKIKREILEKEKLTCTVGIGPNKLIAKIATESAKPNGLLVVKPKEVLDFLAPLPVQTLPGIGPQNTSILRSIEMMKIGELRLLPKGKLKELFRKQGEAIWHYARGVDNSPIATERKIKSVGRHHTFEEDVSQPDILFSTLESLTKEIIEELKEQGLKTRTVTIIYRLANFETHTKSNTLDFVTQNPKVILSSAKRLLLKFIIQYPLLNVRMIGVQCSNLCPRG